MIYNRFHDPLDQRFNRHIRENDGSNVPDRYAAYYTSMYLLADCYEATQEIVDSGFAENPYRGYIEVWGFLQALFISQDSLGELYYAVTSGELETEGLHAWRQVREYRNEIAGHPANRQDRYRSFFGRHHHELKRFQYERFDSKTHEIDYPVIDLEKLRGDYFETDASTVLRQIIRHIDTEIRH